jgi:hypothetical protein
VETGGLDCKNVMPSGFSRPQLAGRIGLPSSKSAGLIGAAMQGWFVNIRCRDACQQKSRLDSSPWNRGSTASIAGRSAYAPQALDHCRTLDRHGSIDSHGEPYYCCLTSAGVLSLGITQLARHHPILRAFLRSRGSPAHLGQSCGSGSRALDGQTQPLSDRRPVPARHGHMEAKRW